jgi:hypothetical protein
MSRRQRSLGLWERERRAPPLRGAGRRSPTSSAHAVRPTYPVCIGALAVWMLGCGGSPADSPSPKRARVMIKQTLKHAPGGYRTGSADISCKDNGAAEGGVVKCGVEYETLDGHDCLVFFEVRQAEAEDLDIHRRPGLQCRGSARRRTVY